MLANLRRARRSVLFHLKLLATEPQSAFKKARLRRLRQAESDHHLAFALQYANVHKAFWRVRYRAQPLLQIGTFTLVGWLRPKSTPGAFRQTFTSNATALRDIRASRRPTYQAVASNKLCS